MGINAQQGAQLIKAMPETWQNIMESSTNNIKGKEKLTAAYFEPYICIELACTQKIMLNHSTIQNGKIVWQKCFLRKK